MQTSESKDTSTAANTYITAPRSIYGYVWFDIDMEQRFTHTMPGPDHHARDVVAVYRDPADVLAGPGDCVEGDGAGSEETATPPFSVSVATYHEGRTCCYLVQLTSNHLPAGTEKFDTPKTFTPFTSGHMATAESKAEDWAAFLGVSVTPSEVVA
jgi:hypothetical protein